MSISIFTDEITRESPQRAIALAAEWGVSHVEVRSLRNGRFPNVSESELESYQTLLLDAGLSVSGVSPGFWKCSVDDPSVSRTLSDDVPRACDWAHRLGTDLVSSFAFRRTDAPGPPQEVSEHIGKLADVVHAHGCRLVLENEASCWGATGLEAAGIICDVDADRVGLCWDPGNSARAGTAYPFPDEYEQIKDLVSHVHIKNFDTGTGEWCLANDGVVDWSGQIEALANDSYNGHIVIETHTSISPDTFTVKSDDLSELEWNTLKNLEFVRALY
ncbi:MAG: sugar phosphate isomerase/epimerase family protein [Gemmatimonadota bacterium]|nr:sugar phosphate isomerase/epimerase family protein [Gemmatimonadota bacterium]